MKIAQDLYDEMLDHARAEAPNECCGMIASRDGEAVKVYPAMNAADAPRYAYEIDSHDLLRITKFEDAGLDLGAIYHSHPRSEPYPSQTDINLAQYPDALYIIVGLKGSEPEVRTFKISRQDGHVAEAELVIG